ncbi:MAG TPA: protein kinase [Polyangiaceae bacterium]|nr:protein kinase [Polyangiaceae bacterium]
MMKASDETLRSARGDGVERANSSPPFPTTSWTVVREAGGSDVGRARGALLELAELYRAPVLAYLRHDGYTESEAEALLGLFFEKLGDSDLLRSIEPMREPFRVWLLRTLEDFLRSDPDPHAPHDRPSKPADPSPESERAPTIPDYQVRDVVGVGAEGTVYRAQDLRAQRDVALKVLRREYLVEPEVVERFRRSVALVSTLDHPNIVRIYGRGETAEGQPYYAMQLVVGGTLAERHQQERFRDPKRAALLVIKLARAIHHAHQRGMLHRDVSPSNVLLDLNGEPFVNDFMAKRIAQSGPGSRVGKFSYMAPEVAVGSGSTVESDIYGLAAILYELWAGVAPIRAESFEGVQRQHALSERKSARAIVPEIPRDLDAVCRAALDRDPSQRHSSAAAFADSLERVLLDFPPVWPKLSRRRRVWLWARRHPVLAIGALLGALLLLLADWRTVMSVRAEAAELEVATLHGNAALASAQARAVLTLFQKLANQVARTAADPEVRDYILRAEVHSDVPLLQKVFERSRSFDSVGVFDADGRILARYPEAGPEYLGREYRFREYYGCLQVLAQQASYHDAPPSDPEVCVSPAYRGEISRNIEFTVAAPVYATSGGFVGFVVSNMHAKNTLEEVEIDDVYHSGQTTALFGQRGADRNGPPRDRSQPKKLTVVAHPGLFSTEERALDAELSRKLVQHFGEDGPPGRQLRAVRVRPWEEASYIDPVVGGNWLAGFAPVGTSGFVVSVATPRATALGAAERHTGALWRYALMLNLGFTLLGAVALRASLRDIPPGSRG